MKRDWTSVRNIVERNMRERTKERNADAERLSVRRRERLFSREMPKYALDRLKKLNCKCNRFTR